MSINWKLRFKNPWFWFGILGILLSAVNIEPSQLTSWQIVADEIIAVLTNPYKIGCVVVAVIGALNDPTVKGLSDSTQALERIELKPNNKQRG